MQVRFRRPSLPHFGQGAFLGAQWTGRTTGVGASVPMVCISGGEDSQDLHSPGCRSYLSRAKRLGIPARLVEISAECPTKTTPLPTQNKTLRKCQCRAMPMLCL